MKKATIFALALMLFASCAQDNSVTVKCDNATVKVTAEADGIFRVQAVPAGEKIPADHSLIIVANDNKADCKVMKADDNVTLATASASAVIDKKSGNVTFLDANGQQLAAESSRSFAPIEVEGKKGYTVRQIFEPVADEGFYGLGQHQADEWDYKGRNEELYQYNTKISIPFIVSSKKYGLLWDSYSFCRWGDPRDYAQLGEVFKLYDKEGVEGALTGTYVPRRGDVLVRRETALAQEFLRTPECDIVKNSPEGFQFGGSHVTFEGEIEPSESGLFHFYLYYAGYTKVYVNGEQVMPEIWRTAWNPNGRKFETELEAGKKVPVRIEWDPDGGVSYCGLRVLSPVNPEEQGSMSWWGEMQSGIDYHFIAANDIDGVISGYRTLTGKAPIMPKWAMGYWQSRERYRSQDEIVGTLKEFRDRQVPVDNIVLDWQYWNDDQWGSHEFDSTRFYNPSKMVSDIHSMDGRFMISVWPKFYVGTEHFNELNDNGWIYRVPVDQHVIDWLGYEQSFYDAYAPGARQLFWQQMKDHLYPLGVDAWWMDASEPNIHDCTDMDFRKAMSGPTALGPSTEYFNAYALMNAQAIYEGQRSTDPETRVFLLTRNGFAGLQRYSTASWSGDIGTRWEDMKTQISAGLNYAISGIPFWGQDIGGFSVENRYSIAQSIFDQTGKVTEDLVEWRELQTRWHEWGVFVPLYRAHGQYPLREPWNIAPEGTETYEAILKVDQMRYRLMPYIYTMDARVWYDDYTMMRPLVMDFTDDAVARSISDQFMFGDAIMVCPVYEYGARQKEVYLPEGLWYDLRDMCALMGGKRFVAEAPYESIPIYARAGQIIPEGELVQSTAEVQKDLTINIFAGADATFRLYEDDGLTYKYEKGECAWIPMSWDNVAARFTVGAREGSFPGMCESRTLTVKLIYPDGIKTEIIEYTGAEASVSF